MQKEKCFFKKNVLWNSEEVKENCKFYRRTHSDTASKKVSREVIIQLTQYAVQTLACLFNLLNNTDVSEGEKSM